MSQDQALYGQKKPSKPDFVADTSPKGLTKAAFFGLTGAGAGHITGIVSFIADPLGSSSIRKLMPCERTALRVSK